MKFYTSLHTKIDNNSAVALGCFDGVHIGHAKIISKAVEEAKKASLTSIVWSFGAPPKSYFANKSASSPELLTDISEKKRLIRALGADILISIDFNEKTARLSPREFFENILITRLHAKQIFCGFNYRFGHKGSGDVALLRSLCEEYGVILTVVDEVTLNGRTVSSSAIREYLSIGDIEKASAMLGRSFAIRGKVRDGQHLGRTLGFPTVNQDLPYAKASLKNGVYLTLVKFQGKKKYGVTNIGMRPTVNGKTAVCETHILDFSGDLYGKTVTVELLKFLRSEKRFSSLDELSSQVLSDIADAKKYINVK